MKKKNVFLVYTEYHLMYAVSVVIQRFSSKNYSNVIIITKNDSKRPLPKNLNLEGLPIHFKVLEGQERSGKVSYKDSSYIKNLSKQKINYFVSFLDNTPYFYYLHFYLNKKGAKIILAPDGAKPYMSMEGFTFLSQFRYTIWLYLNLFKRKMFLPFWLMTSDKIYAKSKLINELWVPFSNSLKTNRKHNIEVIELMPNTKVVGAIFKLFNVAENIRNSSFENAILYVNHPFSKSVGEDLELQILKEILSRNPKIKFFFKLHPLTSDRQRKAFDKLKNVTIVQYKIPAELIISMFSNSVILSFWSNGILTNNGSCRFFWLVNLCKVYLGYNLVNLAIYPDHIKLLNSVDDLKFDF